MASPGPSLPIPLPRLIRALVIATAPGALVLLALVAYADLAPLNALLAGLALAAASAFVAHRHLASLEAVRRRIEGLARDEPPRGGVPESSFGLTEAVA